MKAQSNSKSGHKNISYNDEKRSYVVSIYRNGKFFVVMSDTLEEAIDIRDKAIKFFEEHSRLPKKSDIGLTRRKNRVFKRREKKIRSSYICEMCGKVMSYSNLAHIKEFKERGNVCGHCLPKDRSAMSLEINENQSNLLNEKYISSRIDKYGHVRYNVVIEKRRRAVARSFTSLEDAVKFRDQIVDFFNAQDRLPDDDELANLFGKRFNKQAFSNEPSESDNSATGLKNIAYNKTRNVYHVSIIRNRIKCFIMCKTLEEAKLARKIILETYDETGVMLRSGEVRAKMKELTMKGEH